MVTSDDKDLSMMLKDRKAEKWDLEDEVNRDVWFLNTLAKIKADKEAHYALENGPLTIEKVRCMRRQVRWAAR